MVAIIKALCRMTVLAVLLLAGQPFIARAETPALPALTGRVVDLAGILSQSVETALSAKIEAHENATGGQIVVVTLPDLMGRPIEDWGLMLGRGWGIGQKGKDNGIVFLIAPKDRELRIEVGYGLEGSLPDATANAIIQSNVIPHFKRGDMEGGVAAGLDGILAALDGTYKPPSQPNYAHDGSHGFVVPDPVIPFLFFGGAIMVGLLMSLRRRWDKERNRYVWYVDRSTGPSSSRSSSFGSSGGGFSGGGGSFGGGGASGKW
ncbi:TPM domain-containing protein [Dongia rigui]|uniref:TPM domain-containing protein n=1 Tax=Dongia rigui TaxID=940149 RepID=A0ABU5E4B9_9PROT|nr:TPM domain-containing protein [Dongia rigui]MDY0874187.1 TPM domain-containing protein [Dongia rigui]